MACAVATRGELVIPVKIAARLIAVLDLACPHPGRFSTTEAGIQENLLATAFLPATPR